MWTLLFRTALANGQTSHVWITEQAVPLVTDPELAELLTRDDLRVALVSGTMFPDGGYAVDHPYGEEAHWEPFQTAYLEWIRDTYGGPPWSDDAARHIAFLLGMASHGMADQTYDAMYMARAHVYDPDAPWDTESMDEATDVALAAAVGASEVTETWVPTDVLVDLYAARGTEVDAGTLDQAQALLQIAIWYVTSAAEVPESVDAYAAWWPWACAHQVDDAVPGSPPREAEVVARYWERIWARLAEVEPSDPVIATFPRDGGWGHPTDAASIESSVTLVFAQGIEASSIDPGSFVATSAEGDLRTFDVDLFYGQDSHVVNLWPTESFVDDTDWTLRIEPTVAFIDGTTMSEAVELAFSTGDAVWPAADPPASTGCNTSGVGGAGWVFGALVLLRRRS